jgi:hypothetical protein
MPHLDKKKGEFYMNKKCGHTKNELFVNKVTSRFLNKWFQEIWRGKKKKEVAIWHNFPLATTSLAYVGFQSYETLFSFLHVPINPKNHWSDFVGWTMVECLHKQVFKNLKEVNINVIFSIFKITMNSNFLLQWRLHCIWNYLKFGFDTHWRLLAPQGIHSLKFSN